MNKTTLPYIFSLLAINQLIAQTPITKAILVDTNSFYYTNLKNYPRNNSLPVGMFDSGTGGLTVMNAVVKYDEHNNRTGQGGKDGIPDFQREDFIYLADQANMPYGNYSSVGKTDLLREHILKDAQFMLGNKYYPNQTVDYQANKKNIKALVIACNTATAYGKEYIEALLKEGGNDMKVIGVIDAGAKGALETFRKEESGTIGVFATAGTVASNGYVNALMRLQKQNGYTGQIQFFSQGGVGLAEAIDEEVGFIDRQAKQPRSEYKGPNVNAEKLNIDKTLLDIYHFDFEGYKMLCDAKKVDDCSQLQINSADNYVRYHLVTLLETMRQTSNALPMKTIILGCTHYPYMTEVIHKVLAELRNIKTDGKYRYKHLLAEKINLIDPALNTAKELYEYLKTARLQNKNGNLANSEFYISVPNVANTNVKTEAEGNRLSYEYKYGRVAGEIQEYVRMVPFSKLNIPVDVSERLKTQIPATFRLIQAFDKNSSKTKFLKESEKL